MKIVEIYKYSSGTSVIISPVKTEDNISREILFRLIADEGYGLTRNGSEPVTVIDTDTVEGWEEVPAPDLWVIFDQKIRNN